MSTDESMKEKVFMLEQQNGALAKQYFAEKEESRQLYVENMRHCTKLNDLQKDCFSYQSILQSIYTRLSKIIDEYIATIVGSIVLPNQSQEVLDIFGNSILSDTDLTKILNSSIQPHDENIDMEIDEEKEKEVMSSESEIDKVQDVKKTGACLLTKLDMLEKVLKGEKDLSAESAVSVVGLPEDALRAAVATAGQRLQLLMEEAEGLKGQIRQLTREKANWQCQPESKPKKVRIEEKKPVASPKEAQPVVTDEAMQKQLNALQAQVDVRGEALEKAETQMQRLEDRIKQLEGEKARLEGEVHEHSRHLRYDEENQHALSREIRKEGEEQSRKREKTRAESERILEQAQRVAQEAIRNSKELEGRLEEEKKKAEAELATVKMDRDGFERKLKRHKLFAEVLTNMEGAVHKLCKILKQQQPSGEESEVIRVLKDQLKEMSNAFNAAQSTLIKTRKLVEFGDKKNDQLLADNLTLQKAKEEQHVQLEQEKQRANTLEQEKQKAEQEAQRLRAANQNCENAMLKLANETNALKSEVMEMLAGEESYMQQWKKAIKENEALKKKLEEREGDLKLIRTNQKRERFRFEKRLLNIRTEDEKEVIELIQDEMRRYRAELMCPVCKIRPKDCILTRCQHIFCRECIDERIARRERKCPRCLLPFGVDDVKRVWVINDSQLYDELKEEDN